MTEEAMKVWVVYRGGGYEGYSEPLGVYSSKKLAGIWLKGSNDTYGAQPQVVELLLDQPNTDKDI